MDFGCIGATLSHSFSEEIHRKIGLYAYELHPLASTEIAPFFREKPFRGINVTIPYKQTVLPYLDEISARGKAVGVVNTVINRNGKLYGDNTDAEGFCALLSRMGLSLAGKKVLICGTGGTAKTVRAVAVEQQALRITLVGRQEKEGAVLYENAPAECGDSQILINTTPCGMYPAMAEFPLDLRDFPALEGVVDCVYNPLRTPLVQQAQERGIPAQGGLYMLVAQAVAAAQLFAGVRLDPDLTDRIFRELMTEKQNLVLVGMPSAGKTTVGRLLAEMTNRPFLDTDEETVRRAGKPIKAIFSAGGEASFRRQEAETVRSLSLTVGGILATGGGVPMNEANVRALRMNGKLIYLDRSLDGLTPSLSRPLASDSEKLQDLFRQRTPVYERIADEQVPVKETPHDTARQVWEAFCRVAGKEK